MAALASRARSWRRGGVGWGVGRSSWRGGGRSVWYAKHPIGTLPEALTDPTKYAGHPKHRKSHRGGLAAEDDWPQKSGGVGWVTFCESRLLFTIRRHKSRSWGGVGLVKAGCCSPLGGTNLDRSLLHAEPCPPANAPQRRCCWLLTDVIQVGIAILYHHKVGSPEWHPSAASLLVGGANLSDLRPTRRPEVKERTWRGHGGDKEEDKEEENGPTAQSSSPKSISAECKASQLSTGPLYSLRPWHAPAWSPSSSIGFRFLAARPARRHSAAVSPARPQAAGFVLGAR